jgi:hypothetical protein
LGRLLILGWLCACGESNTENAPGGDEPAQQPEPFLPAPDFPTIDSLEAYRADDGAIGFTFEGRPGPIPVHFAHLEWLDDAGQALGDAERFTLRSYQAFSPGVVARVEQNATRFSGSISRTDPLVDPARVRLSISNQEEQAGPAFESDLRPAAPRSVELGQDCDPFRVLSTCPGSALCDVKDPGVGELPICQEPPESCGLDLPVLETTYEGSNAESHDSTRASCTLSRGNIGTEQGHVFTAPASAAYRFRAESIMENAALTLFVRRYCEFRSPSDSELACGHAMDTEDAIPTVELELAEGDTVYVFVEAWWANGGDYRLSVEVP